MLWKRLVTIGDVGLKDVLKKSPTPSSPAELGTLAV